MDRIIIVSNRLPVNVNITENEILVKKSVGGLATGLSSVYKDIESIWIGWSGIPKEKIDEKEIDNKLRKILVKENCIPVDLNLNEINDYYFGFCNNIIWPLFHYFLEYTNFNEKQWETYKQVNEKFCNVVAPIVTENDYIWIHDYHLLLLPQLLRATNPNLQIGFFLHIPFPSFEMFRLIHYRKEILNGLLGADLIGFHIYDYVRHFLSSVRRLLGVNITLNKIKSDERQIKVEAFPMSIKYEKFKEAHKDKEVIKEIKRIKENIGDRKIVLSIDRLDYTKGIIHRLLAIEKFFEKHPEHKEKVTFISVIVPSRTNVEGYKLIKQEIDEIIGRINGKYDTLGWVPIWYLFRSFEFPTLAGLYIISDIALITPLRDGMNLVAKEFIASKYDGKGFLILSEFAGASIELSESIIINPYNDDEIIQAINYCLNSNENTSIKINIMQNRIKRYDIQKWVKSFLQMLQTSKKEQESYLVKKITPKITEEIISKFKNAKKRLVVLDYDGTLTPIVSNPSNAIPDYELKTLIDQLKQNQNDIIIVSGRDKDFLDRHLSSFKVTLIGEHGIWLKKPEKEWILNFQFEDKWKEEIRPILEIYSDLTPRTFIEEKTFSLVWHYRNADPDQGPLKAQELKDAIISLTANYNLGILEGKKVVDIKPLTINKGIAVSQLLAKINYDFIISFGDDVTDEDTFNVLPESAYTIKVGSDPSIAKFYVNNVREVRNLLNILSNT